MSYNLFKDTDFETLLESIQEVNDFDKKSFKLAKSIVFRDKVVNFFTVDAGCASAERIINSALKDLTCMVESNASGVDTAPLIKFFMNIANGNNATSDVLETQNVVISVPMIDETEKIRPQYFEAFASTVYDTLMRYIGGKMTFEEVKRKESMDSEINLKMKVCRSNLEPSKDLIELAKTAGSENVIVNKDFILNRMVPFLKAFPSTYSNLIKESKMIEDSLRKVSATMASTLNATNKAAAQIDDFKKKCNVQKYMYVSMRKFLATRSYIAFMMAKKILQVSHTISQYYSLYDLIISRMPEHNLYESATDGADTDLCDADLYTDLMNRSQSMLNLMALQQYERYANDMSFVGTNGTDLNTLMNIDAPPQEGICNMFVSINSRIADFLHTLQSGSMFDAARSVTGFNEPLIVMFNDVISKFASGENSNAFDDFSRKAMYAYSDLQRFPEYMEMIKASAWSAEEKLAKSKDYLSTIRNGQDVVSPETIDESLEFLTDIENQFKDLVVAVSKAARDRIRNMSNTISEYSAQNTIIDENLLLREPADDMLWPYYANERNTINMANAAAFTENAKEYIATRAFTNEGLYTFFEDGEQPAPAPAEGNNSSENQPNSTDSNGGENSQATSGQAAAGKRGFIDWIVSLLGKLMAKILKWGPSAKDIQWLRDNRSLLLGLDVGTLQITMPNYASVKPAEDLQRIVNTFKSIDLTKKKEDIITVALSNEPFWSIANTGNKDDTNFSVIKKKCEAYYNFGKENPSNGTYSGENLKKSIEIMLNYCQVIYPDEVQKFHDCAEDIEKYLKNKANSDIRESPTETKAPEVVNNSAYNPMIAELFMEDGNPKTGNPPAADAAAHVQDEARQEETRGEAHATNGNNQSQNNSTNGGSDETSENIKRNIKNIVNVVNNIVYGMMNARSARYRMFLSKLKDIVANTSGKGTQQSNQDSQADNDNQQ